MSDWTLPSTHPVVLLPMRLETRFLGDQLAIRVLPDLNADFHEPVLTEDEGIDGDAYWAAVATAPDGGQSTWRALVVRYGAPRAAWITRSRRPGASAPQTANGTWSRAAFARALPTRWTAIGALDAETTTCTGSPIKPVVPLGPDPADASAVLPAWMSDFDSAKLIGMGLLLPLTPAMAMGGLDRLDVFGVDESGDPDAGAQQLGAVLDAHYYTDGLSYLAPGTPTNNTATVDSGYDRRGSAWVASMRPRDHDPPLPGDSDGALLRGWLGLGDTGPGSTLTRAADPTSRQGVLAGSLHSALWAATWGYYLGQLVPGTDEDFRRLDHHNVVQDDAYLRSVDRARLWSQHQRALITAQAGADPGAPGTAVFADAWSRLVATRAAAEHVSTDAATAELASQISATASADWGASHGGDPFTPTGDWVGAERDLTADRTARYAYYRSQARHRLHPGAPDDRLGDWYAGQAAAAWGPQAVRAARRHVVDHLRPGGAVPAISVGRQPYGVLACTSLDRWKPQTGEAGLQSLVRVLRGLRDTVWIPATANVPRLPAETITDVTTAQQTLIRLLSTAPLSPQVYARPHVGPRYVHHLWRFAAVALDADWQTTSASSSEGLLYDIGVPWLPRAAQLIGAEVSAPVPAHLVDERYLEVLTALSGPGLTVRQLDDPVFGPPAASTPLLYRLLRHSALRELADAAVTLQDRLGILSDGAHQDQELVDIEPVARGNGVVTVDEVDTLPRKLAHPITAPDGTTQTIGDYLASDVDDPARAGLLELRAAADTLRSASADDLDRLLRQQLDATSHRLDAWLTSIAHRRLTALRVAHPTGALIGGFGWLEDVRPSDPADPEDAPTYLLAPSLPQAATAAVLRSGYDAYGGDTLGSNPFALDLRSHRVRLAQRILDACRAGQPLGAVTGFLFERRLQDTGAGEYTTALRAVAPPVVTILDTDGTAQVSTPTLEVAPATVDGTALRDAYRRGEMADFLTGVHADDSRRAHALLPAVTAALDALDDAADATADALLAESVHHLVNGNPTAAAASLDTLSHGDTALPELTFPVTPRSALPVTHRVVLRTPPSGHEAPGWPAAAGTRPYATAHPDLEQLCRVLLPDPRSAAATTSTAGQVGRVTIAATGLCALDLVYATPIAPSADPAAVGPGVAHPLRVSATAVGLDPDALDLDTAAPGDLSITDYTAACRLVRRLLPDCRPLTADDLSALGTVGAPTPTPTTGLAARANLAAQHLRSAVTDLDSAKSQASGVATAAALGVPPAAEALAAAEPGPAGPLPSDSFADLLAPVRAEVAARDDALVAAEAQPAGDARETARLRAVFGAELLVLGSPVRLPDALVPSLAAGVATPVVIRSWLRTYSRVRRPLTRLQRVLTALAATGRAPTASSAQLPYTAGDPWVGGTVSSGTLDGPSLQITVLGSIPGSGEDVNGLLVDEWTEAIPAATQLAALAYRAPTPLSEPPQTILVATHPDPGGGPWTADVLHAVLRETFDLARLRAVDPDGLGAVGQVLPATYLASNTADPADTASTDILFPAPT